MCILLGLRVPGAPANWRVHPSQGAPLHTPSLRSALALGAAALIGAGCSDLPVETDSAALAPEAAAFAKGGKAPGADGSAMVQMYVADLMPLNNSGVTGTARFQIVGDKFQARVHAKDLAPGQAHPQHVHAGAQCPFPQSEFDADGDGLVEILEAAPAYGKVLIPLDNILADQSPNMFPVANPSGTLNYQEKTSLGALLMALTNGVVPNPAVFTDLDGEELDMAERTVVLHGAFVKDGRVVQANVEGAEYVATLPVACGTIEMQ